MRGGKPMQGKITVSGKESKKLLLDFIKTKVITGYVIHTDRIDNAAYGDHHIDVYFSNVMPEQEKIKR